MKGRGERAARFTTSWYGSETINGLLFHCLYTNWLSTFVDLVTPLEMKPKAERERIRQETLARGLEASRMTAIIRATFIASNYIPVPPEVFLPKPIHKIVTRRLKGFFTEEQLSHIHKL